jgi:uncharacterized membrane protein
MSDPAGAAAPRRGLVIGLVVSLAFNLFFIGILVGTSVMVHAGHGPSERVERMAARLQLDDQQRAAYMQFIETMRRGIKPLHDANLAVWSRIGDASANGSEIHGLLEQTIVNRHDYQERVADALDRFLTLLSPDQRARFVEASRTENQPSGWRRFVTRLIQ